MPELLLQQALLQRRLAYACDASLRDLSVQKVVCALLLKQVQAILRLVRLGLYVIAVTKFIDKHYVPFHKVEVGVRRLES